MKRSARAAGVEAEVKVLEIRPYADLRDYTANRDIAYRAGDSRNSEILAAHLAADRRRPPARPGGLRPRVTRTGSASPSSPSSPRKGQPWRER
ncbi:hypothetical protein [Sphaerisporangium album]|uniref:hypothetical protein n=1 Tax=Sphaerisporangium album TaxID=509200 RepID=UPI0011C019ED|nr:hypothetical protein [Sphaerisporangium album]